MSEKVRVVDVTARDGLQNEPKPVSTRDKLALIEKLIEAGVSAFDLSDIRDVWEGDLKPEVLVGQIYKAMNRRARQE